MYCVSIRAFSPSLGSHLACIAVMCNYEISLGPRRQNDVTRLGGGSDIYVVFFTSFPGGGGKDVCVLSLRSYGSVSGLLCRSR